MSTGSIDRVQSDLNAMREVLGLGRIWSMVDVRFGYLLAGSCALLALFQWPGSPLGVAMPWAAAPILVTLPVWIGYMAIKSRTLPRREASRRREYRFGAVANFCAAIAAVGYQCWGYRIGLSTSQQYGTLLTFIGTATIIFAIAQPAPRSYPRSYSFACGLPMLLFGLAMPLAQPQYSQALYGMMGTVAFGAGSLFMRGCVRQAAAEEHTRVLD